MLPDRVSNPGPHHRKHCQKNFIFPLVNFWGVQMKKHAKNFVRVKGHGDTHVSYMHWALSVPKQVSNSSVRNYLGSTCGMGSCIY